ncbi:hypothetical protein A2U01_0053784, partial [Trifolium medium]|nr:hypothetical protein [Trifolium medium]
MDISTNNESSSLKIDLVFLGLSLFIMISSSGYEDLYLNVFLGSEISIGSEILIGSEASSSDTCRSEIPSTSSDILSDSLSSNLTFIVSST